MTQTLYRKYRPSTFAEVAEQGHVVRTVTNQLMRGTVAHAYLFSGPRGVGKTTIARLLAKALNCENRKEGTAEPCNACTSCKETAVGRMLDVVEIDAASQTKVEETRENVIENVRFAPTRGKYKVFIIDEVHMLSAASFNAILKTLEEPPAHAVFILATTELQKIPATIISRCQRFDFHRIPVKEMMERLADISQKEGIEVENDVLASIARLSEGCLRDAESILGQLFALGEKTITKDQASLILPATHLESVEKIAAAVTKDDAALALAEVAVVVERGGSIKHLVDELLLYVRAMLFASLGGTPDGQYDPATLERLKDAARLASPGKHQAFLDLLLTARSRQSIGAFPQIPLEIAIVGACAVTPNYPPTPSPISTPSPTPKSSSVTTGPVIDRAPTANPPVTPLHPEVTSNGRSTSGLTLSELTDKWGRCCAYVGERNVALPLILRSAKPFAVEGNAVTISFAYQFHADAMKEQKNLRLLGEAIASVMMSGVPEILLVVDKAKEEEASLDSLAAAFGGQVV